MCDLTPRTLRQCRQFYTVYPLIWQTASAKSVAIQLAPPTTQERGQAISSPTPCIAHTARAPRSCCGSFRFIGRFRRILAEDGDIGLIAEDAVALVASRLLEDVEIDKP